MAAANGGVTFLVLKSLLLKELRKSIFSGTDFVYNKAEESGRSRMHKLRDLA